MKLNSGLVASILALCAVTCVADIPMEKYNGDVAREFARALMPEANELLAELIGAADEKKQPVHLGADDPLWTICGFCNMNDDERMIFRRLYRSYGNRELALSKDGLIVNPRNPKKAVKPAPAATKPATNVVVFKPEVKKAGGGKIATKDAAIEWLKNTDLSGFVPAQSTKGNSLQKA